MRTLQCPLPSTTGETQSSLVQGHASILILVLSKCLILPHPQYDAGGIPNLIGDLDLRGDIDLEPNRVEIALDQDAANSEQTPVMRNRVDDLVVLIWIETSWSCDRVGKRFQSGSSCEASLQFCRSDCREISLDPAPSVVGVKRYVL